MAVSAGKPFYRLPIILWDYRTAQPVPGGAGMYSFLVPRLMPFSLARLAALHLNSSVVSCDTAPSCC